jgi:hypothetical protein
LIHSWEVSGVSRQIPNRVSFLFQQLDTLMWPRQNPARDRPAMTLQTLSLFFDNLVGDPEKRSFCGDASSEV